MSPGASKAAEHLAATLRLGHANSFILITYGPDRQFEDSVAVGDDEIETARVRRIADRIVYREVEIRTCRICGCTDEDACEDERGTCAWVEETLCSVCARRLERQPLSG